MSFPGKRSSSYPRNLTIRVKKRWFCKNDRNCSVREKMINLFHVFGKFTLWRFDSKIQILWIILMTSLIRTSKTVSKIFVCRPIWNWIKVPKIWYYLWHYYAKRYAHCLWILTELYRKVRKMTDGPNFLMSTHFHSFDGNLSFFGSYRSQR